ncbi:MAG: S8 family serine peptidase [Sedimentisphaerales bacterium]|nr:S8 family serine peptidase [Sedimentisphaerales bacterium]
MRARTDVLYVEPNYRAQAFATEPNDVQFSNLWGLHNIGQTVNGITGTEDCDIDAPEAWDIITDACDIVVAVIDSGVDYNHPDLVANMWINEAEYYGDPNVDDDNNTYVDDIYGYDFCNDDVDPMDDNGHGTHCAGTIGAVGDNALGITGVCWQVQIMPIKFLNARGGGSYADAVAAIEYATYMEVDIMSNSWGGTGDAQSVKDAIEAANQAGIIFVAAAGNEGWNNDNTPIYPATYDCDNIISVMATDQNDERAGFSCYGQTSVDLGAPGVNILSTVLNNSYDYKDGTSMAAPHVAGACALAWAAHPDWSADYLKSAVLGSVDIPSTALNCVSGGRLNLATLVNYKPPLISLSVTDNIALDPCDPCYCGECASLNDFITYTISYAPDACDYYSVEVTDYLPLQTFYSPPADPNTGQYDILNQTYTWGEGTVYGHDPCDPNIIRHITVQVNQLAEPCGVIVNRVTIESFGDPESFTVDIEQTPVCCWGGDVIYVNTNVPLTSFETGTSWDNAYRNLQDAISRVERGCGHEIWLAAGTYSPGAESTDTFELPDGISIYGGFVGNESNRNDRDLIAHPTYLTGNDVCNTIIDVDNCSSGVTLDSLIIGKADSRGIYCEDSTLALSNCIIAENDGDGLDVHSSTLTLNNCVIAHNGDDGLYCFGNSSAPQITNCNIHDNAGHGINAYRAYPTVQNTFIHNNGVNGIYLYNPSNAPVIRNATIVNNFAEAIYLDTGDQPDITNCILWHNNDNNSYQDLTGCVASYSCLTYSADPNIIDYAPTPDPNDNIRCNPLFVTADFTIGNFHLDPCSPCKDLGDSAPSYTNELDIDGQSRVVNSLVDIGADEYDCSEVINSNDQTGDGRINLAEFYEITTIWQLSSAQADPNDPNTPNWNSAYDCDNNDFIDIVDLCDFSATDWAWQACYHNSPAWPFMSMSVTFPPVTEESSALSAAVIEQYQRSVWRSIAPEYTPTIYERVWQLEQIIDWLEDIWINTPGIQEEVDEEGFFNMLYQIQDELELLYSQL